MRLAYPFLKKDYGDTFVFTSAGRRGEVRKAVVFELEEDGLYSVVLGDLNENGQLQAFRPTGNHDAKKVLATVANIIEFFMGQNPKAILFLTGTTKRLTELYKKLLLEEMATHKGYSVEGITKDNTCEPIVLDKTYEGYFIFQKIK